MNALGAALMLCPQDLFFGIGKAFQGPGTSQDDGIVGRHRRRKIVPAVFIHYIGIRSLQDPGFIEFESIVHLLTPLF